MIWIGTSGYQYVAWRGTFYPVKMPPAKMLAFYSQQLSTVEINYTFNRLPSETVLAKWKEQTPEKFKFTLKAPRSITHSRAFKNPSMLQLFAERARLLQPKLGILLFQFPPTLKKDIEHLSAIVNAIPNDLRAAFEFRHASWFDEDLYQCLRARNLALCITESEDIRTPTVATADYAYFRLRIENYSKSDIACWAKEIRSTKAWKDVFVYFKHEDTGTGPVFARQLSDILKKPSKRG